MLLKESYVEHHMREALAVAREGYEVGEVAVGCVFVDRETNQVVARGHNTTHADGHALCHAEFNAVTHLRTKHNDDLESLQQYILYVTVEPCVMCASMLKQNGVYGVYFGCANPRFGGNGTVVAVHSMEEENVSTYPSYGGYLAEEAIQLLQTFYSQENAAAPDHKRRRKDGT